MKSRNSNETHVPELYSGLTNEGYSQYKKDNLEAWEQMAEQWETFQSLEGADGNDMFNQCLLPVVAELAGLRTEDERPVKKLEHWRPGERVLDLGAGSGIVARMFAKHGAHVTALDNSQAMLEKGRERATRQNLSGQITYDYIDLTDYSIMENYMRDKESVCRLPAFALFANGLRRPYDIVTISTTVKSLPDIEPLAKALPLMLKPEGRIVLVELHPAFSKPAGHRGMEIFENPKTGKQQLSTYIKVPQYLNIPPTKSEAVRGQPEPLWFFHRPFWALMDPFFRNGLVLDAMREPAFKGDPMPSQAQNYHNFQQTPMLVAIRLRHAKFL
ncbi:hypothetical protein M409DRAFT_61622 [Zasmidium cellare ATCC 36951]|uniref:Methyltransferase domain-containing protein n=1 Tax=Zasmidium cellare ATCC 36951 TaxID=1080233 RepID=A0A6A6BWS0_ZASCE|nr:uncharacterized protein M409DRAFT_61622 [Zasmidium cellare ATCC 36951]KAF2158488.1 hypothetical protein M409DRAFT_61622 [Zasmidium cellare ATCC 36951]